MLVSENNRQIVNQHHKVYERRADRRSPAGRAASEGGEECGGSGTIKEEN